jgi:hypothetical protein
MFQSWTLYLVDPALTSVLCRSSRAEHYNWDILLWQVSPADVRCSRVGQILLWQVSSADVPELDTIPGRSCSDKYPQQIFQS